MGEFVTAGHADRLDRDRVGIHVDPDTYEIETKALSHVMMWGSTEGVYQMVSQTTLDDSGAVKTSLQQIGTVKLSKSKRSVTVMRQDRRLFVISAEALRDVMHGKIPRATVSEIVNVSKSDSKKQATLAQS